MVRKKLVNSFFFYGTIYLGDSMKKKLLVLFLFLSIFMIVGCGKKKEEEKPKVVDEVRDLKEDEINTLMERVNYLYYFDINPAKSFKTSELTNQEVLLWAVGIRSVDEFEFEELVNRAEEYLDFSLEPENVLCMTHSNILGSSDYRYIYDASSKTFKVNKNHEKHSEFGYYSAVFNKYVSSSYKNGDYIITVNKLFSTTNNNPWVSRDFEKNYYATYKDAKLDTNPVLVNTYSKDVEQKFDSVDSSKLVKYTYTFKLKNGNYVLKSYEIEQ